MVVVHLNERGDRKAEYDFEALPGPLDLRSEFAGLFAAQTEPTGAWRNIPTSRQAWQMIGKFLEWVDRQSRPPSQVSRITPAIWNAWVLSRPDNVGGDRAIRVVGRLLMDHADLASDTRRAMARRRVEAPPSETSYSDDQLRSIEQQARRALRHAETRILRNLTHLAEYRKGGFAADTAEFKLGEILDHLAREGDVPHFRSPGSGRRRIPEDVSRAVGGAASVHTWKRLFLDEYELFNCVVLLACTFGWNYTSIVELRVPTDISDDLGPPIHSVQLEKRRRHPPHRYETQTVLDDGPRSGGRLLSRLVALTQPARDFRALAGSPSDRLLLCRTGMVRRDEDALDGLSWKSSAEEIVRSEFILGNARRRWASETGNTVNFRRIRKAVNVRRLRRPNLNSPNTHDRAYVLSDQTTAGRVEGVIAAGASAALDAGTALVASVSSENTEPKTDSVTTACRNELLSPFGEPGVPCRVSFLLCLACTNAVVMPRHLGRLALLHESLLGLRGSLPPDVWQADWSEHFARLSELRRTSFSDESWAEARKQVSAADLTIVSSLIRGQLE